MKHLQMAPRPAMQPGYFMQHPQAAAMAQAQQQGIFPPKMPMQFGNPHQMQDPQQQQHLHQQAFQAQMGMRPPGAINNGMHPMHSEAALGGSSGGPTSSSGPNDVRGGVKQGTAEAGTAGDGQGGSGAGHNSGDGPEEGK